MLNKIETKRTPGPIRNDFKMHYTCISSEFAFDKFQYKLDDDFSNQPRINMHNNMYVATIARALLYIIMIAFCFCTLLIEDCIGCS